MIQTIKALLGVQVRGLNFASLAVAIITASLTACKSQADRDAEVAELAKAQAYTKKFHEAQALFAERCKSAGVVIKRTVKDVEGIQLLKIRPKLEFGDKRYFDPMWDGAAMAAEVQGDDYIRNFLYHELRYSDKPNERGTLQPLAVQPSTKQFLGKSGYAFVEAVDPLDGHRYRYKLNPDPNLELARASRDLVRQRARGSAPRFAVDFTDIVDPVDRAHWIAGTRVRVVDQSNGEVIAEMTRYVADTGFGATATGRLPWLHAASRSSVCPRFTNNSYVQTRLFVDAVLIPKQGD